MDQDKPVDQQSHSTSPVSSSIQIPTSNLQFNLSQSNQLEGLQSKEQQSLAIPIPATSRALDDEVQYLMTIPRRRKRNQKGMNQTDQNFARSITSIQHGSTPATGRRASEDISKELESCHLHNYRSNIAQGPADTCQKYQHSQRNNDQHQFPYGQLQYHELFQQPQPAPMVPQRRVTGPSQLVPISNMKHGAQSAARRLSNRLRLAQPERTFSCVFQHPQGYSSLNSATSHQNTEFTSPGSENIFMDALWPSVSAIEQVFPDHTNFNWNTLTWENPPTNTNTSLTTASVHTPISTTTEAPSQQNSCPQGQAPPPVTIESQHQSPPSADVDSADLRRKPTLYQIPAWKPTTCESPAPAPTDSRSSPTITTNDIAYKSPQSRPSRSNSPPQPSWFVPSVTPTPRFNFSCESFLRAPKPTPESPTPVSPRTKVQKVFPAASVVSQQRPSVVSAPPRQVQSSFGQEKQTSDPIISTLHKSPILQNASPTFQNEAFDSGQSKREVHAQSEVHSSNLIVDIAQTCQKIFPFEEVARRHNTKIEKVIDTFSAIIQLPLLRNASDVRRHGPLGSQRMRDFREAKKAAKAAQHAERKPMKHGRKGHPEEPAQKRIKAGERVDDLRKAAMLKNARDAQASSAI